MPYKGAAEAMTALAAGRIDCAFGAYEEMKIVAYDTIGRAIAK